MIKLIKIKEAMSSKEILFKNNVRQFLKEDGFNTFADYLIPFHVNFCTSEQAGRPFIAAMAPGQGLILINPKADADAISILIRHEIAHDVFKHREHMFAKLKKLGINTPSELAYRLENEAGDYDISNHIYDADDKLIAKHLNVETPTGDWAEFQGLVTELDFPENPEYWTMDFDQLWDVLVKNYDNEDLTEKVFKLSDGFVEGWNALVDAYTKGEITKEQIKQWLDDQLNEAQIESIKNPFKDEEKAQGFNAALAELAKRLFYKAMPGQFGKPMEQDKRLKPLPAPDRNTKNGENKEKDTNSEDNSTEDNSNSEKNPSDTLSPQELKDLIDKIKAARNSAEDVIDDAGNILNQEDKKELEQKADEIKDELTDLEREAKEAKSIEDANKIKARLNTIANFWKDERNVRKAQKEVITRNEYKKLAQELRKAKLNALKRNYNYRPMTISAIVANIVNTIKREVTSYRSSTWSRYNARSDDLGYYSPGRFTATKKNKPSVVFYFDVSGSWSGDKEKIAMGHRIEEALKVLHNRGKIDLKCFYFGTRVHDEFTLKDGGNSSAPVPHALDLLKINKLDNIIIMTDSDPGSNEKLQVPGFAWLLFYDTVSESFAENISGKKGTKIVMIEH